MKGNNKMKNIAIIGCGLGGAALTVMLQKAGFSVTTYEKVATFDKLGAGIHLSSNVIKALKWTGLEDSLNDIACKPKTFISRDSSTSAIIAELKLGDLAIEKYKDPYLTVNRGEFHSLMINAIKPQTVQFGKKLKNLVEDKSGVTLYFEDGSIEVADLVIAADGIKSQVRNIIYSNDNNPTYYTKQAVFRGNIDLDKLSGEDNPTNDITKWWSENRFLIGYYLNEQKSQYSFVAGFPKEEWTYDTPFISATNAEMIKKFSDYPDIAKNILLSAENVSMWPLYERIAEPFWSKGRIVLLGDACHPMRPHMAQGAAMAIEDGAILVRCLMASGLDNWQYAYELYQKTRQSRVEKVQRISGENTWMRTTPNPDWLFNYDAWNVKLAIN